MHPTSRDVGVDLGGTKVAAALLNTDGTLAHRASARLDGRCGQAVADLVVDQVRQVCESAGITRASAVGVSVPGIFRAKSGTVWAPNIPGWDDFPLVDTLSKALGGGTRVLVDSDRAAFILGESSLGAARGARNAIYLAVGTGIGAGILVDGRVLRGTGDVGGAIGWLGLQRPYDRAWDGCGCFEYQASGPGLVRMTRHYLEESPSYKGQLRKKESSLDTADVFDAYEHGDPLATRVIANAIELWGMASANLVSLFNPDIIVFGGGVFGPATKHIARIHAEARRWAQPIAIDQVKFAPATLGADAAIYGAARLANPA